MTHTSSEHFEPTSLDPVLLHDLHPFWIIMRDSIVILIIGLFSLVFRLFSPVLLACTRRTELVSWAFVFYLPFRHYILSSRICYEQWFYDFKTNLLYARTIWRRWHKRPVRNATREIPFVVLFPRRLSVSHFASDRRTTSSSFEFEVLQLVVMVSVNEFWIFHYFQF